MLTWYEIVDLYFEKIRKILEEIENGNNYYDLPRTLSVNHLSVKYGQKNWYMYHGQEKLKKFLYKLQFFVHHNKHPTEIQKSFRIDWVILGEPITFYLFESKVGSSYRTTEKNTIRGKQILLSVDDNGKQIMPDYEKIMPVLEKYSSKKLALAMLNALNSSSVDQTSQGLPQKLICPASIFLLLTQICESAIPVEETIKEYERAILFNSDSKNPKDKILTIKKKTGRIPMGDKITRGKLRDVAEGKTTFKNAFSVENYCIRGKYGTSKGRTWVLKDEAGALTGELSDLSDSDDENLAST